MTNYATNSQPPLKDPPEPLPGSCYHPAYEGELPASQRWPKNASRTSNQAVPEGLRVPKLQKAIELTTAPPPAKTHLAPPGRQRPPARSVLRRGRRSTAEDILTSVDRDSFREIVGSPNPL